MQRSKPRYDATISSLVRIFVSVAVIAVAAVLSTPTPASSHDDALALWGGIIIEFAESEEIGKPISTDIDDHFPPDSLHGATIAETPCSGTWWVYDARHGIAAGADRGVPYIQDILYDGPPPTRLSSPDLSSIRSEHGLHLGMSVAQAAAVFHLRSPKLETLPGGLTVLSLEHDVACGSYKCAHDKIIIFDAGRAVSISLHDHGP